jgi:hypothetical protein
MDSPSTDRGMTLGGDETMLIEVTLDSAGHGGVGIVGES